MVHCNNGGMCADRGHRPPDADAGVDFVAFGGCAQVARVEAWEMGTIWQRASPAPAPQKVRVPLHRPRIFSSPGPIQDCQNPAEPLWLV